MWVLFVVLFIINLFTVKGEVLLELWDGAYIYKDSIIQTIYIILRLIMILMISTVLSSSTTPSELTYGLEFYLKPLRVFHINIGAPAVCAVAKGDNVTRGQVIANAAQGLSVPVHASVCGVVTDVTDRYVEITRQP